MSQCIICTEKFTDKERAKLKCQYCDFESCKKCCKKFLLLESKPRCMNNECDREWTRQFLREHFAQIFLNKDYKIHRENVLFQSERALMPTTQPLVENKIRQEKIMVEIGGVREQISELYKIIDRLTNEHHTLDRRRNDPQRERAVFVRACPEPECRGFLSSQWKCGICEKFTCPQCNVVKGLDRDIPHECNPDDLATAALLNNDTKSCPSCGTGIFKIDGCDQMWCTQCNTAFSWRTGRIESQRNFHNPHYFEWLRRTGGGVAPHNPHECRQRLINHVFIREITAVLNSCRIMDRIPSPERVALRTRIHEYCQGVNHLQHVQYPPYTVNDLHRINENLRIQYMRNFITEESFKTSIQKQEKKTQKNREIANVLNMVVETVVDILHRFYEEIGKPEWAGNIETLNEINQIIDYANECLNDISKTYNSKTLQINQQVRLV